MNPLRFIRRSSLILVALSLAVSSVVPIALRAETPAEQAKYCGGIPLTTELLDKMDAFVKSTSTDAAAKAELTEMRKDPAAGTTPEGWVSAVNSKGPKVVANLKSAGISVDDFAKGMFALMGCAMTEDFTKSEDATLKGNAEFVKANNERATKVFMAFMELTDPFDKK